MADEKDLAVKPQAGALATTDYEGDAGAGFENQTMQDVSIPFLSLLQDGSPQVKPKHADYVPGARAGMMINSITKELYDADQGVIVVPCITEHAFVEWVPRNEGGGFVGKHQLDNPMVMQARAKAAKRNEVKTPDGHDLIETYYIWGLLQRPKIDLSKVTPTSVADVIDLESRGTPILIPFTSTKITPYKTINTHISMFEIPGVRPPNNKPPLWAFPLWFTTDLETRDAGDSYNFRPQFAMGKQIKTELLLPRFRPGTREEYRLYVEARELRNSMVQGTAKVDWSKQDSTSGGGGGDSAPKTEKDIPF